MNDIDPFADFNLPDDLPDIDPQPGRWEPDPPTSPTMTAKPIGLRWHGDSDPSADRAWLVRHLLFETGKGLIGGQWGAGKTFVTLDLSASAMTGETFAGRKVMRTGGVLFIAPEGAFEIPIRLRGVVEGKLRAANLTRTVLGNPLDLDSLPFAWIEECPPLAKDGSLDVLKATASAAASELRERFDVPLVLVIIDTIAAGAGFTDENSAAETQRVMGAMEALSRATGALVLGVDHFGKAVETGIRGSSAKEAAADVVLAMLANRDEAGNVSNTRMAVRKVRGARVGYEIPYALDVVSLGEDQDGEPITTCVVDWQTGRGEAIATAVRERWPASLKVFRSAALNALAEHGRKVRPFGMEGTEVSAVPVAHVRDEFASAYPATGETPQQRTDAKKKAFARAMKAAMDKGLMVSRDLGGVDHLWMAGAEPDT